MKVRVLFFGPLREALGQDQNSIQISPGTTVGDLAKTLLDKPSLRLLKSLPFRYAVNQDFVPSSYVLEDEDEIGLIPPVAGGTSCT